jgi:hypothetical protein
MTARRIVLTQMQMGWNDGDATGWGSAGGEWAVQALGRIIGFRSARAITPGVPQYLSFANTSVGPGNDYGGGFDGTGNIKIDYSGDVSKAAAADVHIGDTPIPGGTVGTKTVVVKNGDAYINSPGTSYGANTTWASTDAIPSYKLIVVGGDIYIDKGISRLDGTYVAIPKVVGGVATGGNIYTCSVNFLNVYHRYDSTDLLWLPLLKQSHFTQCANQLKVFGSLVAKQTHFDRSSGSYGNQTKTYSTTDAAEAIIYGPEMWLSSVPGGTGNYSAITGLPPIL